jgi:hypothetical protein
MDTYREDMRREILTALLFLMIGIIYLILSNEVRLMTAVEKSSIVNSRFYPKMIGGGIVLLSLAHVIQTVWRLILASKEKTATKDDTELGSRADGNNVKRFLIFSVLCVLNVIGTYFVGFIISNLVFLFLALTILECRRIIFNVVLTISTVALISTVFKYGLGVMIPRGILF